MAVALYELLVPPGEDAPSTRTRTSLDDTTSLKYLERLATLSAASLNTTELQSLGQAEQSNNLSIRALSTRSSVALVASADHLKKLSSLLPDVAESTRGLSNTLGSLDKAAVSFAEKYSRAGDSSVLDRRKRALLMAENVDRVSEILEMPKLLASAINAAALHGTSGSINNSSALDLHSQIKRLSQIYPDSMLIASIKDQAEASINEMKSSLIRSLQSQNIKLAVGMRTIGWLRRICPELSDNENSGLPSEGSFGALFLVCRLKNLLTMLEALGPLRELAERESEKLTSSVDGSGSGNAWLGGQQTERYLKRYIEIFREQSFAINSMFKSVFPHGDTASDDLGMQFKSLSLRSDVADSPSYDEDNIVQPIPSALVTFPLYLVELLIDTVSEYLPRVKDKSSRESLLTQVLYCAGSLGRLGGDFSMVLSLLDDSEEGVTTKEWVSTMKKHRVLAGRLESLANNRAIGAKFSEKRI